MAEQFSDKEEQTIEDFVAKLKTDGRYFVGNPFRVDYIARHKKEINQYVSTLGKSEADLVRGLLKINSKPGKVREMSLAERLEERATVVQNRSVHRSFKITPHSSRPRKKLELFVIYPIALAGTIAFATYLGFKYAEKIEQILIPRNNMISDPFYYIDKK